MVEAAKVLVFAVHLAVGTFSESLLLFDFLEALLLCPWTNSLVFAGFRRFFQLELFRQKTCFWIFTQFHSFASLCFSGEVRGGIITSTTT